MDSQVETIKKLKDIVSLISEFFNERGSRDLSETEQHLLQSLQEVEYQLFNNNDEALQKLHNVVWKASQVYKDRVMEELSENEKQLVAKLQQGGYLTKSPDDEFTMDFGFGFQTDFPNNAGRQGDDLFLDADQAKALTGASWHSLATTQTTEAIVLKTMGLLGPHVREAGGDDGYMRCEVGAYIGQE